MKPVSIQNEFVILKPIPGNISDESIDSLMTDIFGLYSDKLVFEKYPEKRISTMGQAQDIFLKTLLGYKQGVSCNHFLYLQSTGEMIGVIEVNTAKMLENIPVRAWVFQEYPQLRGGIEIEFWLDKRHWNKGIMSGLVDAFTDVVIQQGIPSVSAFVLPGNLASKAVLLNSRFKKIGELSKDTPNENHHYAKSSEIIS